MRVLVVTIVHHPQDARILHRQIAALRTAGHQVTYAAPFSACGVPRPAGMSTRDLPRASGRHRLAAVTAASGLLHREGPRHDVVLLHDPELVAAAWLLPARPTASPTGPTGLTGPNGRPVVVWDVHEDTAAAMSTKEWVPPLLRGPAAAAFGRIERAASAHYRLLLAEHRYARRFGDAHPVVPNSTRIASEVAAPGDDRVVYLGTLTRARGAFELVQVGRLLRGSGVRLHVIGPAAEVSVGQALTEADAAGDLVWHGFVPNDRALELLSGAMAGLSLLRDQANYRHSQPTKVIEYMACGLAVVTTPNPLAGAIVEAADCGVVVPFEDPAAAAAAVRDFASDPARVARLAANGRASALADHNWDVDGPAFVAVLQDWADGLG